MSTMVETLMGRMILEGKKFEKQEGYEFPVAEFDDELFGELIAGENHKIRCGIKPSFRKAVFYQKQTDEPGKPLKPRSPGRPKKSK